MNKVCKCVTFTCTVGNGFLNGWLELLINEMELLESKFLNICIWAGGQRCTNRPPGAAPERDGDKACNAGEPIGGGAEEEQARLLQPG
jgi:hypothetical protein